VASIINTGISALTAFQRQLSTTGHNIANVNTDGYSRQRVELDTRTPQASSAGFIGSGVDAAAVRRVYDEFLVERVRNYTSAAEEFGLYQSRAAMVDNIIADPDAGVSPVMQDFFNALQDVADDPTSIPARQVLLNRAAVLSDRFESLDSWLSNLRRQLNQDLDSFVKVTNSLAEGIADLNARILEVSNGNPANPPNDLLDQRDRMVDELSRYVSVSTFAQDDGSLNVFVGNGQALVVGATANRLSVADNPAVPDQKEVVIQQGGVPTYITDQLSGGQIGGLLRFREQVLNPTQNSLGLVAIGLASFVNAEHATGMDLDGDLGGALFGVAPPQVLANPANSGTVTVGFDDVAELTNLEYRLSYDGATWNLTRNDTGQAVAMSGTGTPADPFVADGLSIVIGPGAAAGDSYQLRPSRGGAGGMGLLISDARDIAAADPVATGTVGGNAGTGDIGAGYLATRTGNTPLATPLTLVYNSGTAAFDVLSGAPPGPLVPSGLPAVPYDPATDSGSALTVSLPGLGDFNFTMTGTPANGDQFTLTDNAGGVGDNRNALRLADLRDQPLLLGGTASLADTYGYMVADVGTRTSQAQTSATVQQQLLAQASEARAMVSGVNLDEEAANLVRFQQAYQAAAQVISVANSLFDTLLGAVRR
jgi:flagellar hook-associated protein 1 FlgK